MSKYKSIFFILFMIFLVFQEIYLKEKINKEINKNKVGQGVSQVNREVCQQKQKKNARPKGPNACKQKNKKCQKYEEKKKQNGHAGT